MLQGGCARIPLEKAELPHTKARRPGPEKRVGWKTAFKNWGEARSPEERMKTTGSKLREQPNTNNGKKMSRREAEIIEKLATSFEQG